MVFSSTLFLFMFLPMTVGVYYMLNIRIRNYFLLLCSLIFYAWGEKLLVTLILASVGANYSLGILIAYFVNKNSITLSKLSLALGITSNISVLIFYKYLDFTTDIVGLSTAATPMSVALPLGISFFTFQNISYLIDVYRKEVPVQRNIAHLGLYIAMFPQLIAGPIVRYADIFSSINKRSHTTIMVEQGIIRFIRGLAKKVIIANNLGLIVDKTFALAPDQMSSLVAWIATICYTLQIYFDFSGYSDMAIGLGKMFGFNINENFNYPYIAKSIRDFWRRWHISLSTWFRDYLYIPLGGSRISQYRTHLNLLIVFFITGLWHGASWNFIIWGLFHGIFILIERWIPVKLPTALNFIKHIYVLGIISISWVIFRADTLSYAIQMLANMFTLSGGSDNSPLLYFNAQTIFIMSIGILFAMPIRKILTDLYTTSFHTQLLYTTAKYGFYIILFVLSTFELAQTTYNPFIYFRF